MNGGAVQATGSNIVDAPAASGLPASLPPVGLPGLERTFSRLVEAPSRSGRGHTWHVLDSGPQLDELGVTPVGTVLCVHGNPTWSYLWRGLVAAATDAAREGDAVWRVVAVDQLEMGFSERTGETRRLADRVADLGDLTAALAFDGPVVTLGHDWGGVISLGWALEHRDQLAAVITLNTAVHHPEGVPIPAPLRLALQRPIRHAGTVTAPTFLEVTLGLARPSLPKPVRAAYVAPYGSPERRGGIGDFVADIPVDQRHPSFATLQGIADGLRTLDVPALFLWGPRDPVFSDRYLADLIDRMPHADVHRFEGAGHLLVEDVDTAGPILRWLGERVAGDTVGPHAGAAVGHSVDAAGGDGVEPQHHGETEHPPLWSLLDSMRDSDETALVEMSPRGRRERRTVSWRTLATRVDELAAGLAAHGVRRGDRVSVLVPAGANLTAVLYACLRIGAVVVVADAGLGVRALSRAVRGAWPDHVIGIEKALVAARALGWPGQKFSTRRLDAPLAAALGVRASLADLAKAGRGRTLPEPPAPDDPAAILFTSGSTGPPKGVAYTHRQLSALTAVLREQYRVTPGTGLVAGFAPFALLGPALGATSVTPDMDVTAPATLTATAVADAVSAVDARIVFASPAALANVLATADGLESHHRAALAQVTTLLSAGAPLSAPLLERVQRLVPAASIHTPYGMTEGLLLTDITLDGIRAVSDEAQSVQGGVCVGRPAASARVLISRLDGDGRATGAPADTPGVTGEIVVSAPHLRDHYDRLWLTQSAAEARDAPDSPDTDTVDPTADARWHRTGDVGHLDTEGRLWVEGRLPHVMVTAEGVVTPVGVEQRAEHVDRISRAAAVGVGPRGAQQLVVVAETSPPSRAARVAEAELAQAVRDAVGRPIAAVFLVPRLPTDIRHNSKIDRAALAEWATGVLAGGRMRRPA